MFHYLRGLLRKAQKSTVKRHVPNRPRCQPRLELLENRLAPSVSVVTNQLDYAPGATALFTASGFDSGASVQFKVVKTNVTPNVVETLWSVTDGGTNDQNSGAGTVGTKWYVNPAFSIGANFTLTATGRSGGVTQTATTTFTDGAASLDQAANGPPAAPLASSSWDNGN